MCDDGAMRRSVIFLSGFTAAFAVAASGCGVSVNGVATPAPTSEAVPTSAAAPTTAPTTSLPANAVADPEGKFYTATVPTGLLNATKSLSWAGSYHAVLTPEASPQDNQNYITIGADALHKGDANAIEHELRNPKVIAKDLPPTKYARQAIDGRESVVQTVGPAKSPRDPKVNVEQRVYYIPNKDVQGRAAVVRCRWIDSNKELAKAVETGCEAFVGTFKLK
ncbi:hypothetical protein [Allokutzneria oryzae]|uniref:Lipoprotein n=1 Tax=Allokutzneria oryzae TaxID=1378989 RepID=A0ABV6A3S4_9PSEU